MKKISIIAALTILPITAFAEETKTLNPRLFVEYGVSIYSNASTEYKIDGTKTNEEDTSEFNGGGTLYVGIDFDGIQLGLAPEYAESDTDEMLGLSVRAVVPFMDGNIQPYVSAELGIANMKYDNGGIKFDDTAFAYGIGAGVKYNFNDNMNIKFGLEYHSTNFEIDVEGYELETDMSGFAFTSSIGYRF